MVCKYPKHAKYMYMYVMYFGKPCNDFSEYQVFSKHLSSDHRNGCEEMSTLTTHLYNHSGLI